MALRRPRIIPASWSDDGVMPIETRLGTKTQPDQTKSRTKSRKNALLLLFFVNKKRCSLSYWDPTLENRKAGDKTWLNISRSWN